MATDELVVLLDEDGAAIGTAPKAPSHHARTPLHLAFSCYLFEGERLLLTRRALGKLVFPGVWTNSFCGHPAPGESIRDAVERRARRELGCDVRDVSLVLPDFRYTATAEDGTRENEWCPVVRAHLASALTLAPDEVEDLRWSTWDDAVRLSREPAASPWFRMQAERLSALGQPDAWPDGDPASLLPAATW